MLEEMFPITITAFTLGHNNIKKTASAWNEYASIRTDTSLPLIYLNITDTETASGKHCRPYSEIYSA